MSKKTWDGALAAGLLLGQFWAMASDQAKVDANYDVFATIDKNNDTLISSTEFDSYWAARPDKEATAKKEGKAQFKKIDKNGDGVIDEEEYVVYLMPLPDDELKAKVAAAKAKKAKEKAAKL